MKFNVERFIFGLGIIILYGIVIVYGPLLTIWSVNMLFSCSIPINFNTWFAVFWLQGIITGSTSIALTKLLKIKL